MLLIGNGVLLTRGEQHRLLEKGALLTEGPLIKEIGATAELRAKYPKASYIDARGGLVMPGLINTHHHIYSALARGLVVGGYQPRSFLEILSGLWWKLDSCLTLDDVYYSALFTLIECIKNGCTTVYDHHASYGCIRGSLAAIARAAGELGVRANLCYEVSDRAGEAKMREAVAENAEFLRVIREDRSSMLQGLMGLHASFTLSEQTLAWVRENTQESCGFHIHVAEGPEDQQDSLAKYGQRVLQRLERQGLLGPQTITGHCVDVNEQELDILRQTDTMVVHNPESNLGNAVGLPPCPDMLKRGILLGLGTDGYTNDMLESAKVANVIFKHQQRDPNAAAGLAPQLLFANNARMASRSFGLRLGELKPGAAADIIICEYDPPTPFSAENCDGHILFGLCGRSVVTTVINGQLRMKDRELIGIDEAKILAECRERARGLAWRINCH